MSLDKYYPVHPSWPRIKVSSSLIDEMAYNPDKKELVVLFKTNNSVYIYAPVERKQFDAMAESPSSGSYFIKHIKGNKNIKFRKA